MLQAIKYSQQLAGWCTPEKAERMHELIWQLHGKFPEGDLISVELGVFGGKSLTPMAFAHQAIGRGYAFGCDAWDNVTPLEGSNAPANNEYWANIDIKSVYRNFVQFVARHDIQEYCRWIQSRTDKAVRFFDDDSIVLLHQDGSHNIETIPLELQAWIPKLKIGGFWIADDVRWVEAAPAYAKLPEFGLELREDFVDWQIWEKVR